MKTEQTVQGLQAFAFCVVKVDSTVVFKHFENLKDLIILNILKKYWLCLASWALFVLRLYYAFQHSHKKRKDSLETRAEAAVFSL